MYAYTYIHKHINQKTNPNTKTDWHQTNHCSSGMLMNENKLTLSFFHCQFCGSSHKGWSSDWWSHFTQLILSIRTYSTPKETPKWLVGYKYWHWKKESGHWPCHGRSLWEDCDGFGRIPNLIQGDSDAIWCIEIMREWGCQVHTRYIICKVVGTTWNMADVQVCMNCGCEQT